MNCKLGDLALTVGYADNKKNGYIVRVVDRDWGKGEGHWLIDAGSRHASECWGGLWSAPDARLRPLRGTDEDKTEECLVRSSVESQEVTA